MKKMYALFIVAMLMASVSCKPIVGPTPEPEPSLVITAVNKPYGIQLVTSVSSAKTMAREVGVTYDSEDDQVVVVSEDTDISTLVIPSDAAAVLNSDTGVITPVGSEVTTITVSATDGTNSGTLEVDTSIINLAGTWALRMDETAQTVFAVDLAKNPNFTMTITFYASVAATERNHYNGKVYANRLNAGYYTMGTFPEIKRTWEAVDGHLALPAVNLTKVNGTYVSTEGTDGDSGAYDNEALASILATNIGTVVAVVSPPLDFSVNDTETLEVVYGPYVLIFDPEN